MSTSHLLRGGNLYYIITYDVGVERVNKIKKVTREFLRWEQNSVVSGELTDSQYLRLVAKLEDIIDKTNDHIIIFSVRSKKFVQRTDLGTSRTNLEEDSFFL